MRHNRLFRALAWCALAVGAALFGPDYSWAVPIFLGPVDYAEIASMASADVIETFKRVYLMAVDAVPDATPLTAQLQRTRKFKAGPDGLYFNAKLETGGAVANVEDAKLLPTPSRPKRKQGKIGLAHTYTVIAVGGQSIPLTEDTKNAFVSNLEDQMEDGMTRAKNDLERQYNSDGRGILALLETVASAPTYDVFKPFGIDVNAGPGTMLFIEGMEVAFINPADGTERGRSTVNSVDTTNERITLAGTIAGGAINDFVTLCNDVSATGTDRSVNYLNEPNGILAVAKTGDTFENISGVTFGRWNATVMANSGTLRPITERLLDEIEERIMAKSGLRPTLHYTSRGLRSEIKDQVAAKARYDGQTTTLRGGFPAVKIGDREILVGDWIPKGHWFALNTSSEVAGMADLVPMGYVDLDGAKLHRIEGRHAYRADLWFPHNALWFKRNAVGVIKDLTDNLTILR